MDYLAQVVLLVNALLHGSIVASDGLACNAAVKIKPAATTANNVFILCLVCVCVVLMCSFYLTGEPIQALSVNNCISKPRASFL